jgi:N-acetylneuraminic acid mutarotase
MVVNKYYFSFIAILFLLCSCTNYELTPISNWKQLSNFPGVARASSTSFVFGEKAYVCLGRSGVKYDFLKDVWEYNSITDRWTQKTDFPGAARVKAIGAVIGNKAYVGLGAVAPYNGNQFNDFWEYDITGDSWRQLTSFPGEAKTDLFCAVVDSCIYTTDGFSATDFNQDTYKYSPKTNTWTRLTNFPVTRSSVAGFSIGQNIYLGTGYELANFKDFYCYNTLTDIWSRVADAPEGRVLSKGIAINGKGYLMLGRYWDSSLNGGKLLKDIVEYDPILNKWSRCGDFPGDARQNMVVFTIGGKGYVVGGEDDNERKSDVWVFQP